MDDLLEHGIAAYKAGKRDEARKFFIVLVKSTPDHCPLGKALASPLQIIGN
jgi:hypothetical protein